MFRNKLKIYKSLDTLKILTFWKIIETNNFALLDSGYFEGKKYSKKESNQLNEVWQRLYDEYFVLRADSKSKQELKTAFDTVELQHKIKLLHTIMASLDVIRLSEHLLDAKSLYNIRESAYKSLEIVSSKIKFNHFSSLSEDIQYLNKFYTSLQNTYNLKHKKTKNNTEKQVKNVYNIVANAEDWLSRNLDINEMVVSHWLAIEEQVIQKQKAQKDGK